MLSRLSEVARWQCPPHPTERCPSTHVALEHTAEPLARLHVQKRVQVRKGGSSTHGGFRSLVWSRLELELSRRASVCHSFSIRDRNIAPRSSGQPLPGADCAARGGREKITVLADAPARGAEKTEMTDVSTLFVSHSSNGPRLDGSPRAAERRSLGEHTITNSNSRRRKSFGERVCVSTTAFRTEARYGTSTRPAGAACHLRSGHAIVIVI